jgi:hypothetical protein
MSDEGDVIYTSSSPDGRREAIVESDGRTVYFYLFTPASEGDRVRACWVRNLVAAPDAFDGTTMEDGRAPPLPRASCKRPSGDPVPDADDLRVVWLPDGDGAALFERDELLAIIPGWSRGGVFPGYARDCIGESSVAWGLPSADSPLFARIRAAEAYWQRWERDEEWPRVQDVGIAALERALGKYVKYYAGDGKKWPPRALLRFDRQHDFIYATVGVSVRPQPDHDMADEVRDMRHIELACAMDRSYGEPAALEFARYLNAQAELPWALGTWLGHGHTIPCDALPTSHPRFEAVLLVRSAPDVPSIDITRIDGDSVSLLWLVPITGLERELAEKSGSAELIRRLRAAGVGAVHRPRTPVV